MPSQKRDEVRQHCDVMLRELSKTGQILLHLYEEYNDGLHEEYADSLKKMIQMADILIECINNFRNSI